MDWTAILVALVSGGSVGAIVTAVIRAVEKKMDKKSIEREALRLLILGEIREYGNELMKASEKNGGIEQMDYQHFEELYKVYKALDGDGFADKIYTEIGKLQILL